MTLPYLSRFTGLSRVHKRFLQVAIDLGLIGLCYALALFLRLESLSILSDRPALAVLPLVAVPTIAVFIKLGLYNAVIRYISGRALQAVFLGVLFSTAAMQVIVSLLAPPIPATVPAIYGVLLFVSVGGIRFAARAIIMQQRVREKRPVLIYGAGATGSGLVESLRGGDEFDPVGFIDDDRALHGTTVAGLDVWSPSELRGAMRRTGARAILLAMPGLDRARRREIIAMLEPLAVEVLSLPEPGRVGSPRRSALRPVLAEDLLGRDPMRPREELMAADVAGKSVLVTGAGGSIGSELCRQILRRNPARLVLLDVSEYALYTIDDELARLGEDEGLTGIEVVRALGSVQNPGRMRAILTGYGVQTVYHAAAYKHVPLVEENVVEGVRNNVFGTRILAEAAAETGVGSFILISSDKAVRPSNVMGATKRMAELICQALASSPNRTRFSMVRFGNVLGSSGSVIPRFREQIERGGPVTVTHREITRYFMTITEAAQLVIQAGAMARGGDVFVLDMGEPVKVFDLARSMIRLHGFEPHVIENGSGKPAKRGRVGIRITGLRKGEKLYEEMLLGGNPTGTEHPRILTAQEAALDRLELEPYLDRLFQACLDYDLGAIRRIFLEAPLAYEPSGPEPGGRSGDLVHLAPIAAPQTSRPPLRVVERP